MEIINRYSRVNSIEDGVLIDAMIGDFESVSRQHYKYPVAMTAGIFAIMEQAVNTQKYCNDYAGVWHDILHMAKHGRDIIGGTGKAFEVIIQRWDRTSRNIEQMKILCGPGDNAEPVLTVMLPDED